MFCERCNRPFSLSCKCCKIWTIVKLFLLHFNTLLLGTPHCKPNSFFDRWNIHSQKVYERKLNTFKRFSIELQLPVYILKNILTYFPLKSCVPKAVFLFVCFFVGPNNNVTFSFQRVWYVVILCCQFWCFTIKLKVVICNPKWFNDIKHQSCAQWSLSHTHTHTFKEEIRPPKRHETHPSLTILHVLTANLNNNQPICWLLRTMKATIWILDSTRYKIICRGLYLCLMSTY